MSETSLKVADGQTTEQANATAGAEKNDDVRHESDQTESLSGASEIQHGDVNDDSERTREFRKTGKYKDYESFSSQHHHSIGTGLYLTDEILDLPPRFRTKVISALENAAAINNIPLKGDPMQLILAETVRDNSNKQDKSDSLVTFSTTKIITEQECASKLAFDQRSGQNRRVSSSSDGSARDHGASTRNLKNNSKSLSGNKHVKDNEISRGGNGKAFKSSDSATLVEKLQDSCVSALSLNVHPKHLPLSTKDRQHSYSRSFSNPYSCTSKKEFPNQKCGTNKDSDSLTNNIVYLDKLEESFKKFHPDVLVSCDGRSGSTELMVNVDGVASDSISENLGMNHSCPKNDYKFCGKDATSVINSYSTSKNSRVETGGPSSFSESPSKHGKNSVQHKSKGPIENPQNMLSNTPQLSHSVCDKFRNNSDSSALQKPNQNSSNIKPVNLLPLIFGPNFGNATDLKVDCPFGVGGKLKTKSMPSPEYEAYDSPRKGGHKNKSDLPHSKHERSNSQNSVDSNQSMHNSRNSSKSKSRKKNDETFSKGKPGHRRTFSKEFLQSQKSERTEIDCQNNSSDACPTSRSHTSINKESGKDSVKSSFQNSRDSKFGPLEQSFPKSNQRSNAKYYTPAKEDSSLKSASENTGVNNLNKVNHGVKGSFRDVRSVDKIRNITSNDSVDSCCASHSHDTVDFETSALIAKAAIGQECSEDDEICNNNLSSHSLKGSSKVPCSQKDNYLNISEVASKNQKYSKGFEKLSDRKNNKNAKRDRILPSKHSGSCERLDSNFSCKSETKFQDHSQNVEQRSCRTSNLELSNKNSSILSRKRTKAKFDDADSVKSESWSEHSFNSNSNFGFSKKLGRKKDRNDPLNDLTERNFNSGRKSDRKGCVENGFFLKLTVSEDKRELEYWVNMFKKLFPFPFDIEKCCHFSDILILSFESKGCAITGHKILCDEKKKERSSNRPRILQVSEIKSHVIRPCDCKQAVLSDSIKEIEEKTSLCLKILREKETEVRQSQCSSKATHQRSRNNEMAAAKNEILETFRCCKRIFLDYKNFILAKIETSESLKDVQEWKVKFMREYNVFKRCLPIYTKKDDILRSVRYNSVTVIKAETGSGKSTQLADYIFHSTVYQGGLIICTQPRKLAAITIAQFVSGQMGSAVGKTVGYDVGMERKRSDETKILYMTDYCLLKSCLQKDGLREVSFIIIDEAHERSLYTDLLLGKLKQLLPERPDLRIIVTSATITSSLFLDYFDMPKEADINVPGRSYPVEVIWWNETVELGWNYLAACVQKALEIHRKEKEGDILVFLTSPGEAEEAANRFRSRLQSRDENPLLYCLHGKSDSREQMQVFEVASHKRRKIIFATNIAETSVTIPGVKYVVDSGMSKDRLFDAKKGKSYLAVNFINKSSAEQRKGRAGRTQSGVCYRLYDESNYSAMAEGAVPELLKSNLQKAVLKIFELGIEPSKFDFIESPPEKAISNAIDSLEYLGAVENRRLTGLGYKLAKLPLEPQLSKFILLGIKVGIGYEIIIIAALLSESGKLFLRFEDNKEIADKKKKKFCQKEGDLCTFLEVYRRWRGVDLPRRYDWCVENTISSKALNTAYACVNEILFCLRQDLSINVLRQFNPEFKKVFERVLFDSFSENLCVLSGHPKLGYFSPFLPDSFFIHPSSSISYLGMEKPNYLVYCTLMETSRNYLFEVTPISEETIQKAYEAGSFTVPIHSLKSLQITPKIIGPFGESVLIRHILGKSGIKVKELESRIKSFTNSAKVHLDVAVDKGLITVYVSRRFHEKISKDILEIVEQALVEMANEEDVIKMSGTSVHYALSSGGLISDIIMPGEYRDLVLRISSQETCLTVESLLKKYGPLSSLDKKTNEQKKIEISVTYKKVKDAEDAFSDLRRRNVCSVSSKPCLPQVSDGKSLYVLDVSWSRCPCQGHGLVEFNSHTDLILASGTLTASTFYLDDNCVLFQPSIKDNRSLYMSNLPPNAEDKVVEREIKKLIPDLQIKRIFVARNKSVAVTDGAVAEVKKKLQKIFGDYTAPGKLVVDVQYPKPSDKNWKASVYFEIFGDGDEAFLHLNGRATLDTHKLIISRVLKSSVSCNLRVYNVLAKKIAEISKRKQADGSCKVFDVKMNSVKDSVTIDFECINLEGLITLKETLTYLVQGDTKDFIGLTKYHFLFSDSLTRTIKLIGQSTNTLISLNRFKKTITFHGLPTDCQRAKEKIFSLALDSDSSISKVFNLKNSALPAGFLKRLYEKYGYDLHGLIDSFNLSTAKVEGAKLSLVGPKQSVKETEKALEKLCQDLCKLKGKSQETTSSEEICPICLEPVTYDFIRLEHCGHAACKQCLLLQLEAKTIPIVCVKENCGKLVILEDIKRILSCGGDKKAFCAAALQYHLRLNTGKISYCPSPDCPMIYRVTPESSEFFCPECRNSICTRCQKTYHYGMTCEMFKNCLEDEFYSLKCWMKQNEDACKSCPTCNMVIEKNEGCNHMECLNCHQHFCWLCLKPFPDSNKVYEHIPYCPNNQ